MNDSLWSPEALIKVGDGVKDREDGPDGPTHLVVEVESANSCVIACKPSLVVRSAYDWPEGWRSHAPRWKVLEPANCIRCLAEDE